MQVPTSQNNNGYKYTPVPQKAKFRMSRASRTPVASRRKSTINVGRNYGRRDENDEDLAATLELEKLEQETTLALQEIDKNLSRANAIINDRVFPTLKNYARASADVWANVNFWKYFFEESAGVELAAYEESGPSLAVDFNTLTNSKSYVLPDETREDPKNTDLDTDLAPHFKKPLLKAFAPEETPTWSTEQPSAPPKYYGGQIQASTPQLGPSRPSLAPYEGRPTGNAIRFDSNDTFGGDLPHGAQSMSSPAKKDLHLRSPEVMTIRKVANTYHRLSISPKKRTSRSPATKRGEEEDPNLGDFRRRSSVIQNLLESSPTAPQPPELLSRIGTSHPDSADLGRLSPVVLLKSATPNPRPSSAFNIEEENTIQRFPTTPNFGSAGRSDRPIDVRRTPLGIRSRYDANDSAITPPPDLQIQSSQQPVAPQDEDVPLPDLETVDLPNKKRKISEVAGNDDANVFLENNRDRNNLVASTIYHSILQQQNNLHSSRENTHSQSISHLFEELRPDPNAPQKEAPVPEKHNDLFEDLGRDNSVIGNDSVEEPTGNTSELGAVLKERLKNLTNYTKTFRD